MLHENDKSSRNEAQSFEPTCAPHPDLHGEIIEIRVSMLHFELLQEHHDDLLRRSRSVDAQRFILDVGTEHSSVNFHHHLEEEIRPVSNPDS